jgi:hypothetical protein
MKLRRSSSQRRRKEILSRVPIVNQFNEDDYPRVGFVVGATRKGVSIFDRLTDDERSKCIEWSLSQTDNNARDWPGWDGVVKRVLGV